MNVQRRAVMPNPTKDTRTSTLRDEAAAMFYLPFAQFPNTEGRSLLPSVWEHFPANRLNPGSRTIRSLRTL
ncbi:MAG: hypothetical protein L0Y58_26095 [Verrucomicrobia subdivision 3 bacterium]|nr:hypothetical protein [Limisphaerales bacterium]